MASIRYYLPEDGDQEDSPNVFLAPKPSRPGYPPLLGQIKGSFPLPGSYHFRFKTPLIPGTDRDKNAMAVWMDCVDDSQPVPVWQNSIIAKVTRIGFDGDFDEDFATAGVSRAESSVSAVSAASVQSAQPKNVTGTASSHSVHSSDSLLGGFDDPPAPAAPAAAAASSVHSSADNLLDVDNHPPAPASGGSLLDMDHLGSGDYRSGANTPTSDHNDLLNMSAPMPSQPRPTPPVQGGAMPAPMQQRQPPMQQGRPPQQAPMQGQYPMQYPPQNQNAAHRMRQMPAAQQQQRNQQNGASGKNNAFDTFSDPLGNLNWS